MNDNDNLERVVKGTIEDKVDDTIDRVRAGVRSKTENIRHQAAVAIDGVQEAKKHLTEHVENARDASIEAATRVGRSAKAVSSELARRANENRRPIAIAVLAVVGAGVLVWALRGWRRRASGPPEPSMRLSGGTPRALPTEWVGSDQR